MCSVFDQFLEMETFQGDLTDVVRGIRCHVSPNSPPPPPPPLLHQPPPSDLQISPFGDPFVTMTDPLLQENNNNNFLIPKIFENDHIIKNQCSIFPRIRISHSNIINDVSPCNSPAMSARNAAAVTAAAAAASPRGIINVDTNSPRNCVLVDSNTFSSQIQISSPRSLSLKRRKSQAKKVVCIPAPAAMNSRSSGEVVPSDLWAWRKYGQKPIKGSPFPRGYYRCSSTKGCSARKQVERSRADPNMLVITYTSEHNHPWPIQRNALAGSTRSSSSSSSSSPTTATKDKKPLNTTPSAAVLVKDEMEMELDDCNNQTDDFFADLDELERDSLSILFSQGCGGGGDGGGGDGEDKTTPSDPFDDFFGWSNDDRDSRSL